MVGLPLAEPKQVDVNMEADFLGFSHNYKPGALQTGEVTFTPTNWSVGQG